MDLNRMKKLAGILNENISEASERQTYTKPFLQKMAKDVFSKWKNGAPAPQDFDYPDYGGLDRRISDKLGGEFVDSLQMELGNFERNKQKFSTAFRNEQSVYSFLVGVVRDTFSGN